jgi:glycosyltransferase involved in cell wall biosynthesis
LELLELSAAHVYLTYPFVLSWSFLEAMAMECPIVASNTGPVLEVLEGRNAGVLVNFFDAENIAEAIVSLLNDRDESRELGKAARRVVLESYDLNNVILPKQLTLIENLMGVI